MNVTAENIWLDTCLVPLRPFLARTDVTDIHINRPGEIWIETVKGAPERHDAPDLTSPLLTRLARQVAARSSQGISREHPLLAASLPSGERVQIVLPPATRHHVAMSIRKHISSGLRLDDYRIAGSFTDTIVGSRTEVQRAPAIDPKENLALLLRNAVRDRRNILVSGGTSSGKTTFLNALMHEIPAHERLILLEDTPELQVPHANSLGLLAVRGRLGEADVSTEDLLIASLRMRPDRIILGEVRGQEAMTFLRAINTGHPGSLSTIHADTPRGAIDQLVMLALQTGTRMRWEDIDQYVCRTIDIIIQLERRGGHCRVKEVMAPL